MAVIGWLVMTFGSAALASGVKMLTEPGEDGSPSRAERALEQAGERIGRTLDGFGTRGADLRERIEGYYGLYRLMKALGMSEADIARLVAVQARDRLDEGVSGLVPPTDETRRVFDGVQERLIWAAQEIDERLDLGGDLVRRVRDTVQASAAGREDALLALERGLVSGRDQLRKALAVLDSPESPDDDEESETRLLE